MKNFYRKQFSNYLGEQRAILDIVIGFTPNPSQTPTPSPTATLQITPSPTGTLTPTPSITASATATLTPTPTNTATNTPTPTNTGTPTQTPTNTSTPTPTMTPSSSPAVPYQSAVLEVECLGGILLGGDSITVDGAPYPLTTSGGTIGVAGCVNVLIRNNTGIIYRMFYGPNSQVCTSPGNTYDEVRLVNFQYNPAIGLMGGYDYAEQLYMSGVLVGGSLKQTAIVNPPADLGNGCPTQDLDLVVTFFVETILPTPTPSVTQTQTPTPTQTPNAVCPQSLNVTSSNTGVIDVATYTRATLLSGTTFDYGYLVRTGALTGYFVSGTAPDGNNYPIFQFESGDTNVLFRRFNGSTDEGWYGVEQFPNPLISGVLSGGGAQASIGFNYTEIAGIRFIKAGTNTSLGVNVYIEYPISCPTPTPTATNTSTPTPTNTLTATQTPTETGTPTPTPTNTGTATPTPTQTPTNTGTGTPTPTATNTSTPTPTPTQVFYSAATAFINAVEGGGDTLTNTEKSAINQLVGDLNTYSLWNTFEAFYPFVGGTSSSTKWNLLNPVNTDLGFRITWYGGMSFSSSGVLGNGTNSGGNSHVNPVSYTGMCMGVYINQGLTATPVDDYDIGGFDDFNDCMIILGYNNKTTRYVNFGDVNLITTTNGSYTAGLLLGQYSGGTSQLFQGTTELVSASDTFPPPTSDMGIGCSWRGGVTSSSRRGYSVSFFGGNALNPTEISNLNTTINNFNTALGR